MTAKDRVKKRLPHSFCVRLDGGTGFIVWPRREVGSRGGEMAVIGFGKTASQAWQSVVKCAAK